MPGGTPQPGPRYSSCCSESCGIKKIPTRKQSPWCTVNMQETEAVLISSCPLTQSRAKILSPSLRHAFGSTLPLRSCCSPCAAPSPGHPPAPSSCPTRGLPWRGGGLCGFSSVCTQAQAWGLLGSRRPHLVSGSSTVDALGMSMEIMSLCGLHGEGAS